MSSNNKTYNSASDQAWPSFVDILSSTIVVLAFALLIVVIVLSVTNISSSIRNDDNESSPSSNRIETDIVSDFRAEFQKLVIIANPSLKKEMDIDSDSPTTPDVSLVTYVPDAVETNISEPVVDPGDSRKQVLGDIPKTQDSRSVEVLKEIVLVQRDVIDQQRKVIEQQDNEIVETVREYQSLLSLITQETEIEDIRQKINPKEDQANFIDVDSEGSRLTGESVSPRGQGTYVFSPSNIPKQNVEFLNSANALLFNFKDNASFLLKDDYDRIKEILSNQVSDFSASGVVIETTMTDYAVSGAEAQRVAVERLLVFRSLLAEIGVPSTMIRLKTVRSGETLENDQTNRDKTYGTISIKKND